MKHQVNIRISEATRAKLDALTARYGTQAEAVAVAIDRLYNAEAQAQNGPEDMMARYEVTYRTKDGKDHVKTVEARNEFEAKQLAGAFSEYVISIINLDR